MVQIALERLSEGQHYYEQKVWDPWKFWLSKGSWKKWTFLPRDLSLSKFQIWNLEISSFEKTKYVPLTSFRVKLTNDWRYIFVISLIREWLNMNEYIYMIELWCFWRTSESHSSFELIYFRNSFCYRIENSWGFRHKILGHAGPWGKHFKFFYFPWDCWNF